MTVSLYLAIYFNLFDHRPNDSHNKGVDKILNKSIVYQCIDQSGSPSRCNACNNSIVPLRARHCRDCERCVLGFDHHCVWFAQCISITRTLKPFILVLILAASTILTGAIPIYHIVYQHISLVVQLTWSDKSSGETLRRLWWNRWWGWMGGPVYRCSLDLFCPRSYVSGRVILSVDPHSNLQMLLDGYIWCVTLISTAFMTVLCFTSRYVGGLYLGYIYYPAIKQSHSVLAQTQESHRIYPSCAHHIFREPKFSTLLITAGATLVLLVILAMLFIVFKNNIWSGLSTVEIERARHRRNPSSWDSRIKVWIPGEGAKDTGKVVLLPPGVPIFDLGVKLNVQQIMGSQAWHWFLPWKSNSDVDGFEWPISNYWMCYLRALDEYKEAPVAD